MDRGGFLWGRHGRRAVPFEWGRHGRIAVPFEWGRHGRIVVPFEWGRHVRIVVPFQWGREVWIHGAMVEVQPGMGARRSHSKCSCYVGKGMFGSFI